MKYGYARVSTEKQLLNRQLDSLNQYKVDRIFTDKYTGTKTSRKGYQELKNVLIKGDEVFIHALDRLGRNKKLIKDELIWFKEKGIVVRILNMPTTLIEIEGQEWVIEMINNIILEVLSTIAEQEREELTKRVKEGLKATKKRGTVLGRPSLDEEKINKVKKLVENGICISNACKEVGVSRSAYYNYS